MFTQLAVAVAAVFAEFKLLSRWGGWVGGWVGGSNGNKANLSPTEAGAGLSLAKLVMSNSKLWSDMSKLCQVISLICQWMAKYSQLQPDITKVWKDLPWKLWPSYA